MMPVALARPYWLDAAGRQSMINYHFGRLGSRHSIPVVRQWQLIVVHPIWFDSRRQHRWRPHFVNCPRCWRLGISPTLCRTFLRCQNQAHQIAHPNNQCYSMCPAFRRPTMEFSMVVVREHVYCCDSQPIVLVVGQQRLVQHNYYSRHTAMMHIAQKHLVDTSSPDSILVAVVWNFEKIVNWNTETVPPTVTMNSTAVCNSMFVAVCYIWNFICICKFTMDSNL